MANSFEGSSEECINKGIKSILVLAALCSSMLITNFSCRTPKNHRVIIESHEQETIDFCTPTIDQLGKTLSQYGGVSQHGNELILEREGLEYRITRNLYHAENDEECLIIVTYAKASDNGTKKYTEKYRHDMLPLSIQETLIGEDNEKVSSLLFINADLGKEDYLKIRSEEALGLAKNGITPQGHTIHIVAQNIMIEKIGFPKAIKK